MTAVGWALLPVLNLFIAIRGRTGRSAHPTRLRQHLLHHMPMHVREAAAGAVVADGKLLVVDAKQMQCDGVEVIICDDVALGE